MKLNFGCGYEIKEGYVNVDLFKGEKIDKSFDFNIFPYPFEDNYFDEVFSKCVLEHLENIRDVINELWRISKNNAIWELYVPYYNHCCAFNEVAHKQWFNDYTFYNLFGLPIRGHQSSSPTEKELEGKFKIIKQEFISGDSWRWIPKKFLTKISHYIPNLIRRIKIRVEVIK